MANSKWEKIGKGLLEDSKLLLEGKTPKKYQHYLLAEIQECILKLRSGSRRNGYHELRTQLREMKAILSEIV